MSESDQEINHEKLLILLNKQIYRSKACFEMQEELNQSLIQPFFKYMMKNPVNLEIQQLVRYFPWTKCIIQAKASGFRCLLIVYKGIVYLMFETKVRQIGKSPLMKLSVFECELMNEEKKQQQLLCYDQHMFEDKPIFQSNYFYRIWKLQDVLDQLWSVSSIDKYYILKAKRFEQIRQDMNQKQIKQVLKRIYDTPFENDGLIINTNDPLYQQKIFKWKPIDKLTIDFKCNLKSGSDRVYHLNVFDPLQNQQIPFTSPIIECSNIFEADSQTPDLENRVGEFTYNIKQNKWVFIRVRDDKGIMGRGNSLKVARSVMANILYNIDFGLLYTGTGDVYFQQVRGQNYKAMTKFINEVKQNQILEIHNLLKSKDIQEPSVLDLGCGKGQDILKFQDFSTIICVDNDKYALWELNQRTSALKTNLKVRTIQANLASWESLNLLPTKIDLLNCNLALHYFIDTLSYIVKTSNPLVINLLIFDGSKLENEQTLNENNAVKYHYHVMKKDPSKIKVKLPFRTQLTEETIIYPDQITQQLTLLNYKLDKYEPLQKIQINNQELSNADIQHINNYSILQYSKVF